MRIDEKEGMIVFDNLLEGDRQFGAEASAVKTLAPAETAQQKNARGTFEKRTLESTHKRARDFGETIRKEFGGK